MRRHAHVDFQLFSQKSSGIPVYEPLRKGVWSNHTSWVASSIAILWTYRALLTSLVRLQFSSGRREDEELEEAAEVQILLKGCYPRCRSYCAMFLSRYGTSFISVIDILVVTSVILLNLKKCAVYNKKQKLKVLMLLWNDVLAVGRHGSKSTYFGRPPQMALDNVSHTGFFVHMYAWKWPHALTDCQLTQCQCVSIWWQ